MPHAQDDLMMRRPSPQLHEVTSPVKTTQLSLASPDGQHVASLDGTRLDIRRTSTLTLLRSIETSHSRSYQSSRFICLKWCPVTRGGSSHRILLAEEDDVRVWDLHDDEWSATIDNGSGGMGKIASAEFGAHDAEVLVWSSFGARVTVWDLWTGKSVELKDPKFVTKGHGRRRVGRDSLFAIISRPAAQDILTLHAPATYHTVRTITLPTTDAQGLKWSPDGRWIAVWDSPAMGYKILIYTADGNLYRTHSGDYFEDDLRGLGVKSIEWSPSGDFLVVGGYESTITLLSTKTFSPAMHLSHSSNIRLSKGTIWREMASPSTSARTFESTNETVQAPIATGSTASDLASKIGVSSMSFSADGSLLATKDDSMPTAVWIWDLSVLSCRAVLLHHSIVKKLAWHPSEPDSLLVQCIQGEPGLYHFKANTAATVGPQILTLPNDARMSGKADGSWMATKLGRKMAVLYGDSYSWVLIYPDGYNEAPTPERSPSPRPEDNEADDSLYEVLSGRNGDWYPDEHAHAAEDTFQFRRGIGAH